MEAKSFKVFTYGTLLKGQLRCQVLDGEKFLGSAQTYPCYRMFHIEGPGSSGYPALIEAQSGGYAVAGELYEISEDKLRVLDQIEGYPWLYTRKSIKLIDTSEEDEVIGYIYQQDVSGKTEILGCWRTFLQNPEAESKTS